MAETIPVSTTEGAVLGLLAFGERSGYELAHLASRSVAYLWTPSRSQIYKVLPRLVTDGFARARHVQQDTRPDKALYRLTAGGRRALRAWLEAVEEEPAGGRVVFPLKLFFCDFASPEVALAQLAGYRASLVRRLEAYEEIEPAAGYPYHVLQHGLTRVRATLGWVDETAAAIERAGRPSAGGSTQSTAR